MMTGCYTGATGQAAHDDEAPGRVDGDGGGDGDGDDGGPNAACGGDGPVVASRPMRRLTPTQYQSTMRDLLGDAELSTEFDDVEVVLTERGVRQLRTGAERAIERIANWEPGLVPCDINGPEDATCANAVIESLAPRAFRRPLSDEERAWLQSVYEETAEAQDFQSAMEALLSTILQAPAFVYHTEVGTAVEGASDDIRALDDYELASRLSYFLWDSMPDAELFEAAGAGLLTGEGLTAQAERMLVDPRAQAKMQAFIWSWLQLDGGRAHFALGEQTKSGSHFPEYTPELVDAMGVELQAFVEHTLYDGDGNFSELFTSTDAYVNASLGDLYLANDAPMTDEEWAWLELDPTKRAGLLTRLAFLSTFASPEVQSPIRRGVFVYEQMLCGHLGEPPPNASDVPVGGGDVDGTVLSVREEVELRTSEAECTGCHNIINNIGFSFEHYDAVGRWRSVELTSGRFIDASGRLVGSDVDDDVTNAVELSALLADSAKVKNCFAQRWVEQAIGSMPSVEDACSVEQIQSRFSETGDVAELMVAIAMSDTFRYINVGGEGE